MSNQVQPGTVQTDVVSSDTVDQKTPLAATTGSGGADQGGAAKPTDPSSLGEVEEEEIGDESDSGPYDELTEDEEPPGPDSSRGKITTPVAGSGLKPTDKPRPPRPQIGVPTKGKTRN